MGLPSLRSGRPYLRPILAADFDGFLGHEPLQGGPRYPEPPRGLTFAQACDRSEPFWIDPASRSAKLHALRFGPCESCSNSLLKPTDRFSTSWTFSPRECLKSERKILRLVHQEPSCLRLPRVVNVSANHGNKTDQGISKAVSSRSFGC